MSVISVILPIFNAQKFLADCLESLRNQTYTDFQVLMIDDGSVDKSLEIIQQYCELDKRFKYRSRENHGLVATLNELLAWANTDLIARMDADDIAYPERFSRQVQLIKDHDLDIVGSSITEFSGIFGEKSYLAREIYYPASHSEIELFTLFKSPFAHPSVIFKKSFLESKNLHYTKNFKTCEDYDLWVNMLQAGARCSNIQEPLLYYRVHDTQKSKRESTQLKEEFKTISRKYFEKYLNRTDHFKNLLNNKYLILKYIRLRLRLVLEKKDIN
jgi:glycosyltransferase involved in cell wall biosynthesis